MLIRTSLAAPMLSCLLAAHAGAQVVRFQDELRGNLALTGNTLGLSKEVGANGPGSAGSIGTFLTTNPASVDDVIRHFVGRVLDLLGLDPEGLPRWQGLPERQ